MNRIILIGNGFDLAHGMKTSYQNFMDDFWATHFINIENKKNIFKVSKGHTYKCEDFDINYFPYSPNLYNFKTYKDLTESPSTRVVFKNLFLQTISEKHYEQNWVDIENEYYVMLKDLVKNTNVKNYNINQLNSDFNVIQKALKNYLVKIEQNERFDKMYQTKVQKNIRDHIYERFYLKDFTEAILNKKVQEEFEKFNHTISLLEQSKIELSSMRKEDQHISVFLMDKNKEYRLNYLKRYLIDDKLSSVFDDLKPKEILFLNFNYTKTEELYNSSYNNPLNVSTDIIHIHGDLNGNINRDIIFGYGDEMDEDYKEIEKLNENEYLTNVKSMKYLENDNYKNLLNFINSDNYQVFIFGHSCGNSDRTLLNTLFEHKNCCSIKPFYHQKPNGEDNFTEIIKNISRNFNSKAKMRDVVVNKEYCKPLVSIY